MELHLLWNNYEIYSFDPKNCQKLALQSFKIGPKIFIVVVIYQHLELKIQPKAGLLSPKKGRNTFQTTLKQLWKSREIDFFDPQNGQKLPLKSAKKSKFLTQNLNFRCHIWTFGAQNSRKSRPFEAKNKAQTLPKQLQNNFEKVQKSTFLTPKKGRNYAHFWPTFTLCSSKKDGFLTKIDKNQKICFQQKLGVYVISKISQL